MTGTTRLRRSVGKNASYYTYKIFNNNKKYLDIKNARFKGRNGFTYRLNPPHIASTIITTTMQDAIICN